MDDVALMGCMEWVAHGFEIVQSLFAGWRFKAADTVAAFALHGALAVGRPATVKPGSEADWAERLTGFDITLLRNGLEMDHGNSVHVLGGGPLAAVRHVADLIAQDPRREAARSRRDHLHRHADAGAARRAGRDVVDPPRGRAPARHEPRARALTESLRNRRAFRNRHAPNHHALHRLRRHHRLRADEGEQPGSADHCRRADREHAGILRGGARASRTATCATTRASPPPIPSASRA